jgi:hypothetical protein
MAETRDTVVISLDIGTTTCFGFISNVSQNDTIESLFDALVPSVMRASDDVRKGMSKVYTYSLVENFVVCAQGAFLLVGEAALNQNGTHCPLSEVCATSCANMLAAPQ